MYVAASTSDAKGFVAAGLEVLPGKNTVVTAPSSEPLLLSTFNVCLDVEVA